MFLECTGEITQTVEGFPMCSASWAQSSGLDMSPIVDLNNTLQSLFTFDAEFLGIAIGGAALLFTSGWGIGVVMRLLNKH